MAKIGKIELIEHTHTDDENIGDVSITDAIKIFLHRSRREVSLKRDAAEGPPNVKIVGPFEVYLLDQDGKEIRQICGARRAGRSDAFVCLRSAGSGTSHLGSGRCSIHEHKAFGDLPKLAQSTGGGNYKQFLEDAEKQVEESDTLDQLRGVVANLLAMRNMQRDKLDSDNPARFNAALIKTISAVDKKLIEALKASSDIELDRIAACNRKDLMERDARLLLAVSIFDRGMAQLLAHMLTELPLMGLFENWDRRKLLEWVGRLQVDEIVTDEQSFLKNTAIVQAEVELLE